MKGWIGRGLLVSATAGCAANAGSPTATPTPSPTPSPVEAYSANGYRGKLVSSSNRLDLAGQLEGGWGPHLRPFMRDTSGMFWYVIDVGPDVLHNVALDYYRLSSGVWERVANQTQIPGVEQNDANLLIGGTIYSYGVEVLGHQLEECLLDTQTAAPGGCSAVQVGGEPLILPPFSNYVGAAVIPGGDRMVWWTTVGTTTTSGKFSYLMNQQGTWTSPITTDLGSYVDFSYVYVGFLSPTDLVMAGELISGTYPQSAQIYAAIAQLHLGGTLSNLTVLYASPGVPMEASEDVWVEPTSGMVHVAAHNPGGEMVGTLSLSLASWSPGLQPLVGPLFADAYRARFVTGDGNLHLLLGAADGTVSPALRDFVLPASAASLPIDWANAPSRVVPMPPGPGYSWPDGVYVQSSVYQTTPVSGVRFGFTGVVGQTDNYVWQVEPARIKQPTP